MVSVHFEGTPTEVRSEMGQMLGLNEPTSSKPAKTSKPAESAPAQAESSPKQAETKAVTFQDVKELIPKLMDKLGKPGLIEFLATFDGAKKGSEIKEADYAKFVTDAKAKLA